jgi:hypothetical protein
VRLAAVAKPLVRARVVVDIFNRIRSRRGEAFEIFGEHSCKLGADKSLLADSAARIRSKLVALLYPLASAFEDLGLDADHLFRRVEADK